MDAAILGEIRRTGITTDQDGREFEVAATCVDPRESEFLASLISRDPSICRTLEVGCAHGVSSLSICQAIAGRLGAHHSILDPFQTSDYHRTGVRALERAGCDFFDLREERSEFALPQIAKNHSGEFDLVFIDGFHTFDHTLLDLFYATRLVRVGGYVVLDDTNWPAVAKAVAYFLNYPAFRLWGRSASRSTLGDAYRRVLWKLFPPSIAGWLLPRSLHDRVYIRQLFTGMAALQKVAPDERSYSWFASF